MQTYGYIHFYSGGEELFLTTNRLSHFYTVSPDPLMLCTGIPVMKINKHIHKK